jgi:hypothetical protein
VEARIANMVAEGITLWTLSSSPGIVGIAASALSPGMVDSTSSPHHPSHVNFHGATNLSHVILLSIYATRDQEEAFDIISGCCWDVQKTGDARKTDDNPF